MTFLLCIFTFGVKGEERVVGGKRVTGDERSLYQWKHSFPPGPLLLSPQTHFHFSPQIPFYFPTQIIFYFSFKPTFTSPQTPFHGNFQLQAFLNSQVHGQYCVDQVRCQPLMISFESYFKLFNISNENTKSINDTIQKSFKTSKIQILLLDIHRWLISAAHCMVNSCSFLPQCVCIHGVNMYPILSNTFPCICLFLF